MKKVFALLAVSAFALAFVACGGKKEEAAVEATPETTEVAADTTAVAADTTEVAADTTAAQ